MADITKSLLVTFASRDKICELVRSHKDYSETDSENPKFNLIAANHEAEQTYVASRCTINYSLKAIPSYMFQEDFHLFNQIKLLVEKQVKIILFTDSLACTVYL